MGMGQLMAPLSCVDTRENSAKGRNFSKEEQLGDQEWRIGT